MSDPHAKLKSTKGKLMATYQLSCEDCDYKTFHYATLDKAFDRLKAHRKREREKVAKRLACMANHPAGKALVS
jgi:hypothetical protein